MPSIYIPIGQQPSELRKSGGEDNIPLRRLVRLHVTARGRCTTLGSGSYTRAVELQVAVKCLAKRTHVQEAKDVTLF
jgi:hypothetical protein